MKKQTEIARKLRRNMSPVERRLSGRLRKRQLGLKFRRQHPIGPYVVDFYCPPARLVIEVDGDSHADSVDYDRQREAWLVEQELRVIRFTNRDVNRNLSGVLALIRQALAEAD